jgi:dienelactone hydrolase
MTTVCVDIGASTRRYMRHDVTFRVGVTSCDAWFYEPEGVRNPPVVILGHGLGATRELRVDAFAERFAAAGIAALAFTHRYFGTSGGTPRQLVSIARQLEDWEAAIAYVKSRGDVDKARIAVWGSSLGGGNAITIASRHPEFAAAIAQCPFTDGPATALALGPISCAKLAPSIILDLIAQVCRTEPVLVPLAGDTNSKALMAGPDALSGCLSLVPEGGTFINRASARVALTIALSRPGRLVKKIVPPILFCICERDTITPPEKTFAYARTAPRGEIKTYPATHFEIYVGEQFEHAVADQTEFLLRHLNASAHR